MKSGEPELAKCYDAALVRDPQATASIRLSLIVAAESGQFKPTVQSNSLNDPAFEECVVAVVSSLKLSKPQPANLSTTYPLEFTPN